MSRRRMTSQAIYNLLQKRATEAGVYSDFSPHDLRRTVRQRFAGQRRRHRAGGEAGRASGCEDNSAL
ncbi:MAG: hypothetical protein U0694_21065 [Anaerolineae bacterium]